MNTTSDETQTGTDVMDVALRTMRKYGMNIITATQHLDVNGYVKSDPRMPRTLNREVRRIVAGPERRDSKLKDGIYYTWPYGWEPCDFTPMMRRIFRGKRTRHVMMLDEMPALFLN